MRYEDREIVGVESERNVERQRDNELEYRDEHELPAIAPLEVHDDKSEHRIVEAMRAILERRSFVINDLALPKRELEALEALKAAVEAKDGKLDRFVFATNREELLEQALVVLQPKIAQHTALFGDLVKRVGDLRQDLRVLEDAEDELLVTHEHVEKAVAQSDDDDGDHSLDGPERTIPKPKSSLDGPEVKQEPEKSTLFDGPAVETAATKSTLSDGPAVDDKPPKSTLFDGAAAPDLTAGPTTLGDAKEIEEAREDLLEVQSKQPWWKLGLGKKT